MVIECGSFDFIDDFVGWLFMDVIFEFVGVLVEDWVELRWFVDFVLHCADGVYDVLKEGIEVVVSLFGYYIDMIVECCCKLVDDFTLVLIVVEVDGDRFID